MKKLLVILFIILLNTVFPQDIINETGKNGKFIVRDNEQNEALLIENGEVTIKGELKVDELSEGKEGDKFVVWDEYDRTLKVVPRIFSDASPLSKPLIYLSNDFDSDGVNNTGINSSVKGVEALTIVHTGSVGIDGSLAIGDGIDGSESFGFNTLLFEENNLRIHFDDNSTAAGYSNNDWTIQINSSNADDRDYFAIVDASEGSTPFLVEGGAPDHSLYVEDFGRVGLGTNTPAVELHVKDSDTPTLRLEQDGSGGWTPQTWDVAGNETNFFIRDVTNGSKLPFRIRPNAPTSSIDISASGDVGIGTSSPGAALDVQRSSSSDQMVRLWNTNGAAKMRFVSSNDSEAIYQMTSSGSWISEIAAKYNSNFDNQYLQFRVRGVSETNSETGLNNSTHMTILGNGNIGIGTTNPNTIASQSGVTEVLNIVGTIPRMAIQGSQGSRIDMVDSGGGSNDKWMQIYTDGGLTKFRSILDNGLSINQANILVMDISSGYIGIGTNTPVGVLDVNGTIYQRGGQIHADYVFEEDYKLESIKEHAKFMWNNKHLPAVPKSKLDDNGEEVVEIGSHRKGILEELEKAHIYIEQLEKRISIIEKTMNAQSQ